MPYGLDKDGFKRKRYVDIRADLVKRWKDAFGEESRTEEKSVNGIIISLVAFVASQLWMVAEKVYNSAFVHKAEGKALSDLVMNRLDKRRPAEKAVGEIEIEGDKGTEIESGFRVTNNIMEYITIEDVEIGESGKVTAPVIAELAGSDGNTPAHTVTEIITPFVGVDNVTNPKPIGAGRDEETDTELRRRYELSLSAGGSPSTNGIRAEVLGVEGVRTATIVENLSLEDDSEGRPGRSYETYVSGGTDEEVAQAIFRRRASGTRPYGSVIVDIEDDSGNIVPIGFSRVDEINIYMEIELETTNQYPEEGDTLVKNAIIEYVGGMDESGNVYTGLQSNENVYFTKLVGIISNIVGVERVVNLAIGIDPNALLPMNDIEIGVTEVARTDYEKIVIL